jgi:hypothetical protein
MRFRVFCPKQHCGQRPFAAGLISQKRAERRTSCWERCGDRWSLWIVCSWWSQMVRVKTACACQDQHPHSIVCESPVLLLENPEHPGFPRNVFTVVWRQTSCLGGPDVEAGDCDFSWKLFMGNASEATCRCIFFSNCWVPSRQTDGGLAHLSFT